MQDDGQADLARGSIFTELATRLEKRLAAAVISFSLVCFIAVAFCARTPLPPSLPFIPAHESVLWMVDTITAVLLIGQFRRLRSRALLLLASGYVFDGWMVIPHALSFPGVFSEAGLLGGGSQTTVWLDVFWHFGFPLFVLGYAVSVRRAVGQVAGSPARSVAVAMAAVGALDRAQALVEKPQRRASELAGRVRTGPAGRGGRPTGGEVPHDLNNILTVIVGGFNHVLRDKVDTISLKSRGLIQACQQEAHRGTRINRWSVIRPDCIRSDALSF